MNTNEFNQFFHHCVGAWETERTYHYIEDKQVERSHTEFKINPLTAAAKEQVLQDNGYETTLDLDDLPGFNLGFNTVSEKGEKVSQNLNLLFVPTEEKGVYLEGDYLRDRAYEEARPIVSHFRFDNTTRELLMTTNYTRVVAVDSITLINPRFRIRKIVNYQRPESGQPLENPVLVGFGVEQKVS